MEAEKLVQAAENLVLSGVKDNNSHTQQSGMATKSPYHEQSIVTSQSPSFTTDGSRIDSRVECNLEEKSENELITKNKRKRRRGRPKANAKPYKKSNWRFQVPKNRNSNCMRSKLVRRCIVPYNTNGFLMNEHLAELPTSLLTPSGRTRDSSFSVDSEDNHFFSMPEDEEEFLTKDFDNAYEKTRAERLEGMSKQQLIDECLQLEDRASIQQVNTADFFNKIQFLEERIRELSNENQELRRKLDSSQNNSSNPEGGMCSSTSEDSESDSSSSTSSSCYSRCSSMHDSKMDSDDVEISQNPKCNGHSEGCSSKSRESSPSVS